MTIRSERRRIVPNLKKLAARGLLAFGLFLIGNFAVVQESQAYLQFFRTDGGDIYEYDDEVCQYDVANKTLTLISDGSVVPVDSAAYTTKLTNTNDRGWLLNTQGYTVSLPGSPYPVFANGNPVMNNLGQLLTTDGTVVVHSPQYEEFNEAYVKPGWNNGQMPTADGINRSGVIDLNDCPDNIFSTGYNGSNLTYYFNDEDAKLYDQRAAMISNVTFCAANIAAAAAATTAAAVAIVIDPSAIVIAGAQTLTATGLTAAAAADLAIFDKYSENFVGAIDFNSSLTVKNSGALHGTYQNIETLLLESAAGNVQLGGDSADQRGDFIVIDKIESKGKLIVNAYGNVAEVNSIVAETLNNKGTIGNVGYLSAAQIENTGTMTAVGTLVASNLTNTNTGTISAETTTIGKKLDNKGTFVNYGSLNAETLDNSGTLIANGALNVGTTAGGTFGTITNSGTLLANGTVSAAHFTNSGTAAIAGSLKITGDINHQGGELTVDGAISAQNINTSGVWYSLGAIRTDRLTISGTETFVSMGSVEAASAIKNGDSSATADSVKGVTYFRENVTAESLENNRVLGTSGNVEISRSVITGFGSVWNAFGSVEVGSHITNYGTINLSENLTVAATGSSGADPGSSEITNYGTINGTSANAVVLVDGNLSGRETEKGTITGLTALTVRGNAENNNIQMGNANSTMTVGGALTNAAVSNVGNLTVKGAVAGSTISGAGNGSVVTLDSGVSGGSITNVDDLEITGNVNVDAISGVDRFSFLAVNGNLAVEGDISRFGKVNIEGTASFDSISDAETLIVAGTVSNDGTITATDQGSTYEFKDGLDNNDNGTISHVESLFVNRELNNSGTISGTGFDSSLKVKGNLNNDEYIDGFESLLVTGTLTNAGAITATGTGANYRMTNLVNSGNLVDVEKLVVTEQSNVSGNLVGAGNGSLYRTGSLYGAAGTGSVPETGAFSGSITQFGEVTNAADLVNDGTISGIGANAIFNQTGSLTNNKSISQFQYAAIDGSVVNEATGVLAATGIGAVWQISETLNNRGQVQKVETLIVAGKVSNDGTITATDQGSTYEFKDGLDNNDNGTISHVESLFVNRELNNNGTISGTGFDSSLKVKGNLNNDEYIDGFESLLVTGTLTNAGAITATGTGTNYRMTNLVNNGNLVDVEKLVVTEQSNVSGNMVGTGNGSLYRTGSLYGAAGTGSVPETGAFSGSITQFGEVTNAADLVNDGTISGIGANALFNQTGSLTNNKSISQFQYAAIDGSVVNEATGVLAATGVGAVWQISETLNNRGQVQKVETLNVAGTGTSENYGVIAGTGAGSRYEFAGNLINQEGAVLGSVDNLRVGGDLTNTGVLAFNQSITVDGDFTNGIDNGDGTYSGKGTLVLNCENGQLGQITVNGRATINGGRIAIEGERLAVGQDYVFLTVEGAEAGALNHDPAWSDPAEPKNKGLTVNQAFQIFATNEAYLENAQLASTVPMVSSAVPKLFHAEGFYNQNEYWVSLRRDYVYGANGRTDNQIAVGTYLDRIAYSLNTQNDWYEEGDLFKVLSALDDTSHCNAPSYESGTGEVSGSNVDEYGYDTTDPNNPAYPYGYPVSGYTADGTPVYGVNAQALDALDQLSGSVYANMSAMTLQNGWFVHQNLTNILRPLDCMCNCDNPNARDHNVWGAALGNAGRIESDGNSAGFHYDTYGLIVGSDLFRNECFRLGGFFQYVNADLGQYSTGSRSDIDNFDLGMYFMHHFAAGYVMATGSVGYSAYDTARTLRFGGEHASVNRTHFSDSDSSQQSFRLERAWDFSLGKGKTLLRPFVGLTYVHLQMDGVDEYSQDGGRYVTQLSSDGYELDSLRSELGLRVSRCFETSCANIGLNARASWVHEFGDTQATIENRFNNPNYSDQTREYGSPYMNPSDNAFGDASSSFIVSGVNLNDDYAWLGLGFTADTNSCWTFFGGYDALVNGKTVIHTGNLGAALNW